MTDPSRWLDPTSDADDFEREVLRSNGQLEIPAGAQERVWQALADAGVTPFDAPPAPTALPSSGTGTLVASSGILKTFAAGALFGALVSGGYAAWRSDVHQGEKPAVPLVRAPEPSPEVPRERGSEESLRAAPQATPSVSSGARDRARRAPEPLPAPALQSLDLQQKSASSESARVSQLREEAALIRRARANLKSGNLSQAFVILEESRTRFPTPVLSEEREALRIELLLKSGREDLARDAARSFLERFPNSPFSAEMRRVLED